MANNSSDGSIVIDTELDYQGFEQGTEKLLKAIGDLTSEIKRIGTDVSKSLSVVVSTLTGISSTTDAIFEDIGQRAEQAATAQIQFVQATSQAREAVAGMATAASGYDAALAKTQKKIDAQKAKMAEYFKSLEEIQASTDEALTHAETDDQAARVMEIEEIQLQNLNDKYAAQLKVLHDLEEEYSRIAAAKAAAGDAPVYSAEDLKTVTADIEKASRAVDNYEAKVQKMSAVGASDSSWKSIQYDIQRANASLSAYRENLDALHAEGKISPEDYERLSSALDSASAKARELSSALGSTTRRGAPFADVMKRIAQSALQTAKNLARISFRALKNGFYSVSNGVKDYIRKVQDAKLQSNALVKSLMSVKRLLITRVKRMFISSIFDSAKEGLQNLAQFSGSFNLAMSNIKNSAKQLSGNLSVALGGFIEKIEPILTGFLDTLSKVISYVNAFFGIMQGKTTMVVAKKQTDNYAKSLDNAAKKQEELNRQVYGFDELNKRNAKEEEEEKEDQNGSPLYEEVPMDTLPDNVKDFLEELKRLWDNEEYFAFGHKIAEALNKAMQIADDWINNVFRPMGVKWAGIIAEVLNGLVDGFDADLFGKLVADSLNAVADIINTFITKFNWERLGEKIGEAIRSFFTNIDWELIGQTFANGWNALIDMIHGIVTTPGMWKSMGDAIGGFIATWFSGINFQKLGETLYTGINGIFTSVSAFTSQLKSKAPEIVKNLSEGINNLITGIDWAGAGRTLSDLVTTLLGTILETAKRIDWQGIGRGIGEFLGSIDWATIFRQVGEIIWTALKGVLDGLFDTQSGRIVVGISTAILAVKALFSAAEIAATVAGWVNAIGGAFPGLLTAASGFVGSLGSILGAIGSVIFSPTGLIMAAVAAAAILIIKHWDEIKVAATQLKDSIATAWENLKISTVEKWENMKLAVSTKANEIKTNLSTAWNTISADATAKWESVKSTISTKFDSVKTSVKTTADTVKSTLTTSWTGLKTEATNRWKAVTDEVKKQYDNLKQPIKTTTDTVKKTLTDSWYNIQNDSRTKWDYIKQNITRPMDDISRSMTYAWNNIRNDTSRTWDSIKSTIMDRWNSLKSSISQSANNDWSGIGSRLVEGLKNGISRAWSGVTSMVSRLASGLTGFMNRLFGIHSPSRVWAEIGEYLDLGLMKGLEDTQGDVLKTVSNMAKGINGQMDLEEATLSVGANVQGTGSELNRVAGILSQIAATFQNITDMLTSMGGLQIPALVSGSVVPARAAISDGGSDHLSSSRFDSFESGLDERLYDQQEVLGEIRDILKRARIGIDTDALADSIAFAMGNAIRGYGGV